MSIVSAAEARYSTKAFDASHVLVFVPKQTLMSNTY